jgi:hypothetical protein
VRFFQRSLERRPRSACDEATPERGGGSRAPREMA